MHSRILAFVLVCGLATVGCGKKREEGGGGGGKTLAGFVASDDYKALIAAATAGAAAVTGEKCDDALAAGKEAVALLTKLVPDYGAIGEAAQSDKTLSDRMSELNAVRATLEMATEGYEQDKGTDTAAIYCKQLGDDFAKLVALP